MKIRLAKLQQQQHYHKPQVTIIDTIACSSRSLVPTPSPITPNSTDELLPSVDEGQEVWERKNVSYILNHYVM